MKYCGNCPKPAGPNITMMKAGTLFLAQSQTLLQQILVSAGVSPRHGSVYNIGGQELEAQPRGEKLVFLGT